MMLMDILLTQIQPHTSIGAVTSNSQADAFKYTDSN